jgi:hypothetical protein
MFKDCKSGGYNLEDSLIFCWTINKPSAFNRARLYLCWITRSID